MESRKLAVSGKIKHYVVDNDNVVTPLIHNNRDIVTFTGNSRFKHRSRGYFESPMNDIPNFNIGKQATLDKHGYRDPKLDKARFFKKQALPQSSSQPSAEPMENIALGKQVTQSSTVFGGMLEELWMAKSMVTMVTILSLIQTSNLSLGGK